MGLLSLPVLLPAGNMAAVDAYFFGASASTESGLNTYVHTTCPRPYVQLTGSRLQGRCQGPHDLSATVYLLHPDVDQPWLH